MSSADFKYDLKGSAAIFVASVMTYETIVGTYERPKCQQPKFLS